MRSPALSLAAAVAAALLPVRADADRLRAPYGGELAETSHTVDVTVDDGRALFEVRRRFTNRSTRVEEVELHIALPSGAVADRFRHKMAGVWMRGTLMNASKASGLYGQLTGAGALRSRGPALLELEYDGSLQLKLYPLLGKMTAEVAYRLTAPLCYRGGYYLTDYPMAESGDGSGLRPATVRARGGRVMTPAEVGKLLDLPGTDDLCDGIGHELGGQRRYLVFPARDVVGNGPARALLGHHRIDDGHQLVRLDLAVPPVIEPAPRKARVVFVVDASRSVGETGVADQLALIRGYLAHLPDARVEIVVTRRWARPLFGDMIPARQVPRRLAALPAHVLAPGNGSHLDNGIGLAAHLVREAGGPVRIVAFTDDRLRPSFELARATRVLAPAPERAVLHLVDIGGGGGDYYWERDDDHRLVPVARARGGVVASMRGSGGSAASARDAMLGLVRPLSIDDVELSLPGVPDSEFPALLEGGDAFRNIWMTGEAPTGARLTGMIWGRAWQLPLVSDRRQSALLPGFAFAHDVGSEIPKQHRYPLAMKAGVVTDVTSLLSRERRARPTSHDPMGIAGWSTSCGCGGVRSVSIRCGTGTGRIGRIGDPPPDRAAIFRGLIRGHVVACGRATGAPTAGLSVAIATTSDEIVDVTVTGGDAALATCVTEATWQLALPPVFDLATSSYTARF
jgi:hypothetical protein